MSNTDYKIHPQMIDSIDYELLLIGFPESDLEDFLTQFVSEKGKISRSYYEDVLIAHFVANLNQFMAYLNSPAVVKEVNLLKVREELTKAIINHNPSLDASNIIINKNNVLKIKISDNDEGTLLNENSHWSKTYYDSEGNYSPIDGSDKEATKNYMENPKKKEASSEDVKSLSELKWTKTKVWWDRIGEYIFVKDFEIDDVEHLIRQRYFHNNMSFKTFIVQECVIDVEELYELIDGMGVKLSPAPIIKELFSLCKGVNEGIDFDVVLSYQKDEEIDEQDEKPARKNGLKSYTKGHDSSKKKKQGLSFKAVKKAELLKLNSEMKMSLIGQDTAVDKISESVKRASVGLKDPKKPIGSFLFAGRTGIGKTLASKVLADSLIKSKKNRIIIDCSEYSSDHEYAKLIGCFVPGSKVLMGDGSLKNIEAIKIGEKVISHTGNERAVEFVHEYDQDGEMVELVMSNTNVPVVTTKTHEVLAIKHDNCDKGEKRSYRVCKPTCKQEYCVNPPYAGYKLNWVAASSLEKNDIVAYPRYKSTGIYPNRIDLVNYIESDSYYKYDDEYIWAQKQVKVPRYIEVNENFTRLAGYYVSEGGSSGPSKTINFTFNSKEHSYITEVVKLIRCVFGNDVKVSLEDRSNNNSHRVWMSSKIVCKMMSDLFGRNTYLKKVPGWFKDLPDNLVKGFLETAVFGDGCTVIKRRMDYSTVSSTLFSQMELLFRRLGYITYKNVETPKNPKHRKRYRLYISGNQVEKLNSEFNFNIDFEDTKNTNIQRKTWIDDNYVYFQLKDIKKIKYTGKVYDLAVEKDTSYVIEFSVHNSPAGYIGHDSGGVLTNAIAENPFSVVVFDEIEKASTKVYDLLLQVLDEGRLTDGKGISVSFKDTIILMTSNIGVKEVEEVTKTIGFGDVALLTEAKKNSALDTALKGKFKPEFLNRIDSIVHFKDLNKKDYMQIIDLELTKLSDNLHTSATDYKDIELIFDNKVRNFIYKEGVDEKFGARPITRAIEKFISTDIATELLSNDYSPESTVNVSAVKGKIKLTVVEPKTHKEKCLLLHEGK